MPTALTPSQIAQLTGIDKLLAVIARLRHPTEGCPWDLKQTHATLKPYMLEEAYEAVEVMDDGGDKLCEELGDVLLQVTLHAQIAQDHGEFDFSAVADGIAEKLIRRHPHVFGEVSVANAEEVTANWEQIKQRERAAEAKPESILDGVSKHLPALSRALETSKRAVKVGFEWPDLDSLWACVMSEYDEFRHEADSQAPFEKLEDEMGDILFATVNLARHFKIDPEVALTKATAKFTRRFQTMERLADKPLEELDFDAWDSLWNQAKQAK